jgi:hypothetical protein
MVMQAWLNPLVMAANVLSFGVTGVGLADQPPLMALATSPPCKVSGAIPLAEFNVRDIGGISVMQCVSMALVETPRSSSNPSSV